MTQRRSLLIAGTAACLAVPLAWAQQKRSLKDPLRLGVDVSLVESGLGSALQKAFGRDTGIAVQVVPGTSLPLLEALERGEFDAALTNAPEFEAKLDKQGLVHDRRAIAQGSLALVGPAPTRRQPDPAGVAGLKDIAEALSKLRDAALAAPSTINFMSPGDQSGLHAAEQALWRTAKVAPGGPWYSALPAGRRLGEHARANGAYAIVERGAWSAQAGSPLTVLVDADPRLALPVHAMRSFRVNHPAGKIFVAWIAGPKGRRVVSGLRGYRPPG
jgi:tungstate transport system substrate-binding protein